MSTESNGAAAPNVSALSANAAPATLAPVAPPVPDPNREPDNDPAWLPKRLERERKNALKDGEEKARAKLLADLGVDDLDKVKQLTENERKRAEAAKSQEQKLAELQAREQQRESELKTYRESTKVLADEQLASLTEEQRNAVKDLAGEDPAKQIKAIATLRPTWAKSTQSDTANGTQQSNPPNGTVVPPVPATKPAPATAPANTAPPPSGGAPVVPNHLETYTAMTDPNSPAYAPFFAAVYGLKFGREIADARKARGL